MTIPDSAVSVLAGSESVSTVRRVFDRGLGADSVLLRMLWADSRSETSPQRVGCGLPRESPANIARGAPQRAGRRALSPVLEHPFVEWSAHRAGSLRFSQKKVFYEPARGFETSKIEVDNISIT